METNSNSFVSLTARLYPMFPGRYTRVLKRTLTVNTVPQDGACRPLTAQGSRCCLQQRPCSAGEYRSQRRVQKPGEADGTAGGGALMQREGDRPAERLRHMARVASSPGQGRGHWSQGPQQADPDVDSRECSRCLTPCGDNPSEGEDREEGSTDHSGPSPTASLHLYLPSPFYDEDGEEKVQEDARHPAVLLEQQETTVSTTALPAPSQKGPKHSVTKQKKPTAARARPTAGQEGQLSAGSRNTPTSGPFAAKNCSDLAGGSPPPSPAPSPEHPLQEEDRPAQVTGPPWCPPPRRLAWRPSKAKDNYYERAVLTQAADRFKLKTTTTLEWGLHGPQARKTVFILQAHSGRPASSHGRATTPISGRVGHSRPSSSQSCQDLSHLQGPDDTKHCDLGSTSA